MKENGGKRQPVECDFRKIRKWPAYSFTGKRPRFGAGAGQAVGLLAPNGGLASGQSSTIVGTLAGQVVMEGFMRWRIKPWLRRLITRLVAVVPAALFVALRGGSNINDLLVLSQVILALQLPFAMFPLLHIASSRSKMGKWKLGWFLLITGWGSALLITAFDIFGLPDAVRQVWHTFFESPL